MDYGNDIVAETAMDGWWAQLFCFQLFVDGYEDLRCTRRDKAV